MRFDETCKVIVDSMDESEAKAFCLFLKSEVARHQMDIDNAQILIYNVREKFKLEEE